MGGTFKEKGIVIKEYQSGEWDKNLVLLLPARGRTNVYAKGVRSPKSKNHAACQLFTCSEFVIYEGNGFLSLTQSEVINNFYNVRTDFEKLCCASHIAELADKMILSAITCKNELNLIYRTLDILSKSTTSPKLTTVIFEFKFFQEGGFSPVMDFCVSCRKSITEGFFTETGLVCDKCSRNIPHKVRLSEAASYAVKYILKSDLNNLFKFTLKEQDTRSLLNALKIFRNEHLGAEFRSMKLLDETSQIQKQRD